MFDEKKDKMLKFDMCNLTITCRIKVEITFIFRLRRHPIQLLMLVPVGFSLPL